MVDSLLQSLADDPDADVDLAEIALLMAADEYPDLDVRTYLDQIDDLAELVKPLSPHDLEGEVRELTHVLFELQGFSGNSADYYDPRNSYLNEVLDRGLGIPITLSVLSIAVGRRLGMEIVGVGLPGHFIVKALDDDREILFDPFHGGRVLTADDCEQLVQGVTGRPFAMTPAALAATPPGAIVTRMLNNLRGIYTQRGDQARMARVLGRLRQLNPQDVALKRDLGAALVRAGKPGQAIDYLREYLEASPYAADAPDVRALLSLALGQVARWN